ncbi:unnamed protein product [Cylicocyclus nassatus]|uniref:Uncharacterized protein n=1 Tax=Cylicocyclus nassatus TaxID=53992 RepID=A0AA36DU42_CYLNA|nr:unnamed protein product [Cylicocyclus nassatus]
MEKSGCSESGAASKYKREEGAGIVLRAFLDPKDIQDIQRWHGRDARRRGPQREKGERGRRSSKGLPEKPASSPAGECGEMGEQRFRGITGPRRAW